MEKRHRQDQVYRQEEQTGEPVGFPVAGGVGHQRGGDDDGEHLAPGKDQVHLRIINDEKITNLSLLNLCIDYVPDLKKRLSTFVPLENQVCEES